jgi:hypothetical protein
MVGIRQHGYDDNYNMPFLFLSLGKKRNVSSPLLQVFDSAYVEAEHE